MEEGEDLTILVGEEEDQAKEVVEVFGSHSRLRSRGVGRMTWSWPQSPVPLNFYVKGVSRTQADP